MITRIEGLNYRCLRYVDQPLEPFHILVGPNASGKTTFLDVVAFCSRVVSDGLEAALSERSATFTDLVFGREGSGFELAVEAAIPARLRESSTAAADADSIRYELAVAADPQTGEIGIQSESVRFREAGEPVELVQKALFPSSPPAPETIQLPSRRGMRRAVSKSPEGVANFYSEVYREAGKGWVVNFRLGPQKSALGNLPEDASKFPVTTWFKELLTTGIQSFVLDSQAMRLASPPGQTRRFKPDGSNLPWVIDEFRRTARAEFREWINHLQTALPDIEDIDTIERPDDRHRYLVVQYRGGLRIPSWTTSDGTLRLLALTLPAYLPNARGVFLIEEPENGIHPRAVETVFQALCSVYDAQVLLASHSPVLLSIADPEQILCFAKEETGAVDIVRGSEHPELRHWQRETSLGDMFAAGVLG